MFVGEVGGLFGDVGEAEDEGHAVGAVGEGVGWVADVGGCEGEYEKEEREESEHGWGFFFVWWLVRFGEGRGVEYLCGYGFGTMEGGFIGGPFCLRELIESDGMGAVVAGVRVGFASARD